MSALAAASLPAGAATSSTVVSATVPSATSLGLSACPASSSATSMGQVLPGASKLTTADCTVSFGSSNDIARLVLRQQDNFGAAMHSATSGTLDTGHGAGGAAWLDIGTVAQYANDVDLGPANTALIATRIHNGTDYDMAVIRVDAAGALDTAFGGGDGIATAAAAPAGAYEQVNEVATLADGSIIGAGYADMGVSGNDFSVVKWRADGSLDPSFGSGGIARFSFSSSTDYASDLVVQPDGRIVIAGAVYRAGEEFNGAAFRVRADGALDTSFGSGGLAEVPGGPLANDDRLDDLALAADGSIFLAGTTRDGTWDGTGNTYTDAHIARLTVDGQLHTGFNATGQLVLSADVHDFASDVVVGSDDRVTFVGSSGSLGNYRAWMVRRNPDGTADATLGGDGDVLLPVTAAGDDRLYAAMSDHDGQLLIGGQRDFDGARESFVAKVASDGSLNSSFGTGGQVVLGAGVSPPLLASGVDGGVLLAGDGINGADRDPVAFRLTGGATVADYVAAATDWDQGASAFGACLRAVAGSLTAAWTVDADATCTPSDADPWQPVLADRTAAGALVAQGSSTGASGSASLRFGMRAAAAQAPGGYYAPVTFEVLAP